MATKEKKGIASFTVDRPLGRYTSSLKRLYCEAGGGAERCTPRSTGSATAAGLSSVEITAGSGRKEFRGRAVRFHRDPIAYRDTQISKKKEKKKKSEYLALEETAPESVNAKSPVVRGISWSLLSTKTTPISHRILYMRGMIAIPAVCTQRKKPLATQERAIAAAA